MKIGILKKKNRMFSLLMIRYVVFVYKDMFFSGRLTCFSLNMFEFQAFYYVLVQLQQAALHSLDDRKLYLI
jgi:hypothetical protein